MKRSFVAILLVVTLLMSCVCSVSAAVASKEEFLVLCESLKRDVKVPVYIEGKLVDGTYNDTVRGDVGDEAVFHAVLDMTDVKLVVTKMVAEAKNALDDAELAEFMALPVSGSFTITATWTGVDAPDDIATGALAGFTFDGETTTDIFTEGETRNVSDNTLESTISIKSDVVVADLADGSLPDEIILEVDGFALASDGAMNGTITGSTSILNAPDEFEVNYDFTPEPIVPVTIKISRPGTGGTSVTTFHTLKYETNGGTAYADESIVAGKTIDLTKVPEKEGYTFAGWYEDAALTKKITSIALSGDATIYAAWTEGTTDVPVKDAHPVPEMLNGEEHYAYLSGYEDGTIRPNSNITRAEVATIFFRMLKDEVRDEYLTKTNSFVDVNEGDWFNTAISTMANAGVVKGRTDDEFAPDEYITRAEFTTICARFDDANSSSENKFTDISEHWAEDYILEAVSYGWIEGYEDNSFRPEQNITRAEAATLINRVLNRVPENADALLDSMVEWPDNANETAWYYVAIQEASNSHTYERIDAIYEKWLELTENRDWTVYEK